MIIQEAINNAVRHSECSELKISIAGTTNWTTSILDNGKGFDLSNTLKKTGNGLSNMQLRAAKMNGKIEWRGVSPHGTEVYLSCSPN